MEGSCSIRQRGSFRQLVTRAHLGGRFVGTGYGYGGVMGAELYGYMDAETHEECEGGSMARSLNDLRLG